MQLHTAPLEITLEVRGLASNIPKSKVCYFCGGAYSAKHVCPANGKICSQCRKSNRFAKVCQSKTVSATDEGNKQTGATPEDD